MLLASVRMQESIADWGETKIRKLLLGRTSEYHGARNTGLSTE